MPIFSLPNKFGIGSLGKCAFDFINFLKKSGQHYWQILPICPPAKEDSPYLSYSTRAGNPYFIDIDRLEDDGWITKEDIKTAGIKPAKINYEGAKKSGSPLPSAKINYKDIKKSRSIIFDKLFDKFFNNIPKDYFKFCEEHSDWINNYALFMSLLKHNNYKELYKWPNKYKYRNKEALDEFAKEHTDDLNYHKMLQYFFYTQWRCLQKYAKENDIKIIGDIPFYVALTSVDVWIEPQIFNINDDYSVLTFSGCPANKANKKDSVGQVWDSPVYNWDQLKKTNYKWWANRLKSSLNLYDIIRIDHFKGFEKYFNISAIDKDPRKGIWKNGPGLDFWKNVSCQLGYKNISDMPIFAEDLGIYTPELKKLVEDCQFEGMKVVQYAFNDTKNSSKYIGDKRKNNENKYLPQNYEVPYVSYLGTHDSNTLIGYMNLAKDGVRENYQNYYEETNKTKLLKIMINDVMNSKSIICILVVQDLLELAEDARINTPGTVGINWMWQLSEEQFNKLDANKLYMLTKCSERL